MLTAIELGTKTLTSVTAKLNGRGPEIVHSGTTELAGLDVASLKAALGRLGAAGPRTVLVIPRGQVLLRELELPAGTPQELVAMVRFQVEREMPFPLDQVRYSYVEKSRGAGKVRVQVVAVPRDVIDPAVAAVEAAGVKVSGAYVSSFGLLALYRDAESAALVEVGGGEAEILVTEGGRMEFSRTAPLESGTAAAALAAEVERTLLSWSARAPGRDVRKVVLAGEGEAASTLAAAMGERLGRTVTVVGPGDLESAPVAGVVSGLLRGTAMPDLLHPPSGAKKFSLTKRHRLVGLAGMIVVMVVAWSQTALSDRRASLEEKRREIKRLEPLAAEVTKLDLQTRLAHEWYRDRASWLDVLSALRQAINPANVWIANSTFEDGGVVRLQGKARDDSHVTDFVTRLKKSEKFLDIVIEKMDATRSSGSEYRKDFTIAAHLAGYAPKKKK